MSQIDRSLLELIDATSLTGLAHQSDQYSQIF
jgi:hypothetical protein